jgi:hypothetical protein
MAELPEMPDVKKEVPDAYHGTSWVVAQKIVSGGFIVMRTPGSFMGDGVYFYEGSVILARHHAVTRKRRKQYGILKATIKLGRCLDLNTPEHYGMLQDTYGLLVGAGKDPEKLTDMFIINFFASRTAVDTVKWTMCPEASREIYPNSRIHGNEPMICVRNTDNITDISIEEDKRK